MLFRVSARGAGVVSQTLRQFTEACGPGGSLVVGLEGTGELGPQRADLGRPFAVIGRSPGADLTLDHWQVSRRHVYLQRIGHRIFWLDLESRTGVQVEGRSGLSGWLDAERPIRVGPITIRPWPSEADEGPDPVGEPPSPLQPSRGFEEELFPRVTLVFPGRSIQRPAWPVLPRMVLIGRAAQCKIRLNSP